MERLSRECHICIVLSGAHSPTSSQREDRWGWEEEEKKLTLQNSVILDRQPKVEKSEYK